MEIFVLDFKKIIASGNDTMSIFYSNSEERTVTWCIFGLGASRNEKKIILQI